PPAPADPLRDFMQDRVKFYFKDHRGFKYDEVNAAMAAGWSNLVDLEARLVRVQSLRPTPDFEPLAASFKRIRNILEQANVGQTSWSASGPRGSPAAASSRIDLNPVVISGAGDSVGPN